MPSLSPVSLWIVLPPPAGALLFAVPDLRWLLAFGRIAEEQGTQGVTVKGDERPKVTSAKGSGSCYNGEDDKKASGKKADKGG